MRVPAMPALSSTLNQHPFAQRNDQPFSSAIGMIRRDTIRRPAVASATAPSPADPPMRYDQRLVLDVDLAAVERAAHFVW